MSGSVGGRAVQVTIGAALGPGFRGTFNAASDAAKGFGQSIRALDAAARSVAGLEKQERAVREAQLAWRRAQAEVKKLADGFRDAAAPTEKQTAALAKAERAAESAERKLASLNAALSKPPPVSPARARALAETEAAAASARAEVSRLNAALSAPPRATDAQAAKLAKLQAAAGAAAEKVRALDAAQAKAGATGAAATERQAAALGKARDRLAVAEAKADDFAAALAKAREPTEAQARALAKAERRLDGLSAKAAKLRADMAAVPDPTPKQVKGVERLQAAFVAAKEKADALRDAMAKQQVNPDQQRELDRAAAAAGRAKQAYEAQAQALERARGAARNMGVDTRNLAGEATRLGSALGDATQKLNAFNAAANARRAVGDAARDLAVAGATAYGFGRAMKPVVETTSSLEHGFARLGNITDDTDEKLAALKASFIGMSRIGDTNQSVESILKMYEQLAGKGMEPADIEQVIRPVARFATANSAPPDDSANLFFSMAQNMGIAPDERSMARVGDILGRSSQLGGFDPKDLAKWAPEMTSLMQRWKLTGEGGVSFLGAVLQTSLKNAASADQGANNMKNVFSALTREETAKNFLEFEDADGKKRGVDLMAAMRDAMEKGENPVLRMLEIARDLAGDDPILLGRLFSDTQAQTGVAALLQNTGYLRKVTEESFKAGSVTATNYARIVRTLQERTKELGAQWSIFKDAVGTALLPVLTPVVGALSSVLQGASALISAFPGVTAGAVGAAAAFVALNTAFRVAKLAAAATGLASVGKAVGFLGRVAFPLVAAAAPVVAGAVAAVGAAVVANPIGAAVAALAAAGALVYANWGRIGAAFSGIGSALAGAGRALAVWGATLGGVVGSAYRWLSSLTGLDPLGNVTARFRAFVEFVSPAFEGVKAVVGAAFDEMAAKIDRAGKALQWMADLVGNVLKGFADAWDRLVGARTGEALPKVGDATAADPAGAGLAARARARNRGAVGQNGEAAQGAEGERPAEAPRPRTRVGGFYAEPPEDPDVAKPAVPGDALRVSPEAFSPAPADARPPQPAAAPPMLPPVGPRDRAAAWPAPEDKKKKTKEDRDRAQGWVRLGEGDAGWRPGAPVSPPVPLSQLGATQQTRRPDAPMPRPSAFPPPGTAPGAEARPQAPAARALGAANDNRPAPPPSAAVGATQRQPAVPAPVAVSLPEAGPLGEAIRELAAEVRALAVAWKIAAAPLPAPAAERAQNSTANVIQGETLAPGGAIPTATNPVNTAPNYSNLIPGTPAPAVAPPPAITLAPVFQPAVNVAVTLPPPVVAALPAAGAAPAAAPSVSVAAPPVQIGATVVQAPSAPEVNVPAPVVKPVFQPVVHVRVDAPQEGARRDDDGREEDGGGGPRRVSVNVVQAAGPKPAAPPKQAAAPAQAAPAAPVASFVPVAFSVPQPAAAPVAMPVPMAAPAPSATAQTAAVPAVAASASPGPAASMPAPVIGSAAASAPAVTVLPAAAPPLPAPNVSVSTGAALASAMPAPVSNVVPFRRPVAGDAGTGDAPENPAPRADVAASTPAAAAAPLAPVSQGGSRPASELSLFEPLSLIGEPVDAGSTGGGSVAAGGEAPAAAATGAPSAPPQPRRAGGGWLSRLFGAGTGARGGGAAVPAPAIGGAASPATAGIGSAATGGAASPRAASAPGVPGSALAAATAPAGPAAPNAPRAPLTPAQAAVAPEGSPTRAMLDLIGKSEGTDKGRGYDETLGYGAYTGGAIDLQGKTVAEVRALQRQMLANPANKWNSSAVGRYQVVGTTLDGLIRQGVVRPDERFDAATQDRIGAHLLQSRGMGRFERGEIGAAQLQNSLAMEWASLPRGDTGRGHYGGQNASVGRGDVAAALSGRGPAGVAEARASAGPASVPAQAAAARPAPLGSAVAGSEAQSPSALLRPVASTSTAAEEGTALGAAVARGDADGGGGIGGNVMAGGPVLGRTQDQDFANDNADAPERRAAGAEDMAAGASGSGPAQGPVLAALTGGGGGDRETTRNQGQIAGGAGQAPANFNVSVTVNAQTGADAQEIARVARGEVERAARRLIDVHRRGMYD